MSKPDITLAYGREGTEYSGSIAINGQGEGGAIEFFSGHTFPRMMSRLAKHIRDIGEVRVVLERTEVPDSTYILDEGTVELMRTDPAAAISSMTQEDRVVYVRDPAPVSEPGRRLLRTGHDTLAASFGDQVYVSVRKGSVECPFCGRWAGLNCRTTSTDQTILECCKCRQVYMGIVELTDTWCAIDIQTFINDKNQYHTWTRFYLPREWNPRGWITREDLKKMYETFNQERENAG